MSGATQGLKVMGSIIMFLMKMNTDSISQDLRRFDRGFCTCVSQRATRRRWHIGLDSFVAAAPPRLRRFILCYTIVCSQPTPPKQTTPPLEQGGRVNTSTSSSYVSVLLFVRCQGDSPSSQTAAALGTAAAAIYSLIHACMPASHCRRRASRWEGPHGLWACTS